jgi:hypothetical protein
VPAILAILAALLTPQITGFLRRGDRAAYDADKQTLELSVIAYHTAGVVRVWPTHNVTVGRPVDGNTDGDFADIGDVRNGMIDIPRLVAGGFLGGPDAVRSARGGAGWHIGANSTGRYIWYVANAAGTVRSLFWRPTPAGWIPDFQGVYP